MFILGFISLGAFGTYMYNKVVEIFMYNIEIQKNFTEYFEPVFLSKYIGFLFTKIILVVLPMLLVSMVIGIITNVVQVGWVVSAKPLMPKFSKLNPINGFKRIFSLKAIVELFKSLAKFTLILYVVYNIVKKEIGFLPMVFTLTPAQILAYGSDLIVKIGVNVGAMYMFIAGIDYAYTKYKHNKDLKMSKQEIKEEYKQAEGDPHVKGKIRAKMREASMRRMMQDLPSADVIITNPTHYAVAIKYDKEKGNAPIVTAKGADHLAKRIREKAAEFEIEIVEDKPLARTLYANCEVGEEIPPELYKAVAEILAYVYKLKDKSIS